MGRDDNEQPRSSQLPASDPVQDAFEQLHTVLRDAAIPVSLTHDLTGELGRIRALVREYRGAMFQDSEAVRNGEPLHKDQPNINRFKSIPKRPRGFVDAAHSAEYGVSTALNAFVSRIGTAPLSDVDKGCVAECLRSLAEALDDIGLYMDQAKTLGASTTMPQDPEVSSMRRVNGRSIFRRIDALAGGGEKNR